MKHLNHYYFLSRILKLNCIVDFINSNKSLPDIVDSSKQFILYKKDKNIDITFDYFENYNMISLICIEFHVLYDRHNFILLSMICEICKYRYTC